VAQRLLVWWKADPAHALSDPEIIYSRDALAPWGLGPQGVAIDLADRPLSLHRRTFHGSREDAVASLRVDCRQALPATTPPETAVSDEEVRLVSVLSRRSPTESATDQSWSLYEIPGPLAMVIGVRDSQAPDGPQRVVCWGTVLPLGEGAWSVLRITPRPLTDTDQSVPLWPLPGGSRPGLAVRDELGGQFVTFTGDGPPEAWQRHYDDLARERDWTVDVGWRIDAQACSAAWLLPHPSGRQRLDLRFINLSPTRQKDPP
jgi:hypothetical protein